MTGTTPRSVTAMLAVIVLVAACGAASTSAPPPPTAPSVTAAPLASTAIATQTQVTSVAASAMPTPKPTGESTPKSTPGPTFITGWPTVSQSGITITGRLIDEPPPFEGCPYGEPAITLAIMITGLAPGESVSLVGSGTYDFALGCGVQPSPCQWGSETTDPTGHLCEPEYAQDVEGTARPTAKATAASDGTAAATLRFVVSQSERVCPAGPSRPWYIFSGEWKLRVTDKAHGLGLVGPPDMIYGP